MVFYCGNLNVIVSSLRERKRQYGIYRWRLVKLESRETRSKGVDILPILSCLKDPFNPTNSFSCSLWCSWSKHYSPVHRKQERYIFRVFTFGEKRVVNGDGNGGIGSWLRFSILDCLPTSNSRTVGKHTTSTTVVFLKGKGKKEGRVGVKFSFKVRRKDS